MILLSTLTSYNIDTVSRWTREDYVGDKKHITHRDLIILGFFVDKLRKSDASLRELEASITRFINHISRNDYKFYFTYTSRMGQVRTASERKAYIKEGKIVKRYGSQISIIGGDSVGILIPIEEVRRIIYQLYTVEYFTLENISFYSKTYYNKPNFQIRESDVNYSGKITHGELELVKHWVAMGFNMVSIPELELNSEIKNNLLSSTYEVLKSQYGFGNPVETLEFPEDPNELLKLFQTALVS